MAPQGYERRVCIASGDVHALSYSAVSFNPEIVAVADADRNLTITAMQEEGGAEITVTVAEGNTTVGTIVYPVLIVPPWSGRITVCNAEYDADEDATYLTVEGGDGPPELYERGSFHLLWRWTGRLVLHRGYEHESDRPDLL